MQDNSADFFNFELPVEGGTVVFGWQIDGIWMQFQTAGTDAWKQYFIFRDL